MTDTKRYSLVIRLGENKKANVLHYNTEDLAVAEANVFIKSFGLDADIAIYKQDGKRDDLIGEYTGHEGGFKKLVDIDIFG